MIRNYTGVMSEDPGGYITDLRFHSLTRYFSPAEPITQSRSSRPLFRLHRVPERSGTDLGVAG